MLKAVIDLEKTTSALLGTASTEPEHPAPEPERPVRQRQVAAW